MNVTIAEHIGV